MSGRKRDRRRLPVILFLTAWVLLAAGIAHPTPGAALGLVFVAGLVVGAAIVHHTDSRRAVSPPHDARRAAADAPRRAAAPRPAPPTPPAGPGGLHAVPPAGRPNPPDAAAALRAKLAARADQVSTRVESPSAARERET